MNNLALKPIFSPERECDVLEPSLFQQSTSTSENKIFAGRSSEEIANIFSERIINEIKRQFSLTEKKINKSEATSKATVTTRNKKR